MAGGWAGSALDSTEVLIPGAESWTAAAALPLPLSGPRMANFEIADLFLVGGGDPDFYVRPGQFIRPSLLYLSVPETLHENSQQLKGSNKTLEN